MKPLLLFLYIALGIISALLTVYDKRAAKSKKYRVPENLLLLVAFFGGATGMYAAMQAVRHKTQKAKFTVSLPVMIIFHLILLILIP